MSYPLIGPLLFGCLCMATAGGADSQSTASLDRPIESCANAPSGSITAALTCGDKAEAMRQLDEAGCFVNNAAEVEVRSVWFARESLPSNAAARDRTIQLFMAACMVEGQAKSHSHDPAYVSAVTYLRSALRDPDPQIAGIAMLSLWSVLTKDDIDTLVSLASTQSALAMPAVTALTLQCTAEAKSGVAAIQSVYAGSEQGNEVQRLVEGNAALCDDDGRARRAKFSGKVLVPVPPP